MDLDNPPGRRNQTPVNIETGANTGGPQVHLGLRIREQTAQNELVHGGMDMGS